MVHEPVVGETFSAISGEGVFLDGAYLACGRLDCAVLAGTRLWDVVAGLLLAREAGVVLGGVDGRPSPALILAAAPGVWNAFSTCDAAGDAVER